MTENLFLLHHKMQKKIQNMIFKLKFYRSFNKILSVIVASCSFIPPPPLSDSPRIIRRLEKNHPIFWKVAKTVAKTKKWLNIYIKAKLISPKHLHQTTFETLKYQRQIMFQNCWFRWNCKKMLMQKVVQMLQFLWATSSFQKSQWAF